MIVNIRECSWRKTTQNAIPSHTIDRLVPVQLLLDRMQRQKAQHRQKAGVPSVLGELEGASMRTWWIHTLLQ